MVGRNASALLPPAGLRIHHAVEAVQRYEDTVALAERPACCHTDGKPFAVFYGALRTASRAITHRDFGPCETAGAMAMAGIRAGRQRVAALPALLGALPVLRGARKNDRVAAARG